jgi:hypothetical protein
MRAKLLGIDGVHRHSHAGEARVLERLRQICQQMSVGSQSDIERLAAFITVGALKGRGFCHAVTTRGRWGL